MSGRLPSAWVDEVFARADIVQIVSAYLPLKKQGQNHWGLCPFHNEKTPSFSVNAELNLYHCFGCKAGGSVVQFVMEMEKLTYPEALLYLAKQYHIAPPRMLDSPQDDRMQSLRQRIFSANREAARYYHETLWSTKGHASLEYLRSRGMDDVTIRRFGIGASADEWTGLCDHLLAKEFTQDELLSAALIHVKEKSRYDVFRNRLMFPIIGLYGDVLGFGARALGNEQPKYLNTADTPVFNKRQTVYGVNYLRKQRNLKHLVLVEGYMDVITLTQHGVTGAVATLGTSLTVEQARLMKRFAPEVWISYDGDDAGQLAAERALDILEAEQIPARVMHIPGGLDPDDLIRRQGIDAYRALRPMSAVAFRLHRIERNHDLTSEEGRTEFAIAAAKILNTVRAPVELENHLKALSLKTGFSRDVLVSQMNASGVQPRTGFYTPKPQRSRRRAGQERPDEETTAEKTLISLLSTGLLPPNMLTEDDFETDLFRNAFQKLTSGQLPAMVLSDCEDEVQRSQLSEAFSWPSDIDRETAFDAAEECLKTLRARRIDRKIKELKADMTGMSDDERKEALHQVMALSRELSNMESRQANGKEVS